MDLIQVLDFFGRQIRIHTCDTKQDTCASFEVYTIHDNRVELIVTT